MAVGDPALFNLLMRMLWSWEWPFSHELQSGIQQQDPQVTVEILQGQRIPGPRGGQEATASGTRDLKAKGWSAWVRDSQQPALGGYSKRNCLNSASGVPAEEGIHLGANSLLQSLIIHIVTSDEDSIWPFDKNST